MMVAPVRFLVLVNVALAIGLGVLWLDQSRVRWSEPDPIKPDFGEIAPAPAMKLVEVSRFRETVERPLFSHTRRPAQATAGGEQSAAVDPFKDVQLLGLFSGGDRGGAVVSMGGSVRRVRIGQKIGDWTVTGIEARSATLVRGDSERRELSMALRTDAAAVSRETVAAEGARVAAPASAAAARAPAVARPKSAGETVSERYARALARRAQQGTGASKK